MQMIWTHINSNSSTRKWKVCIENISTYKWHILLILFIFLLWLAGPILCTRSFWIFAGFFGPTNNLQNVFTPISTLFSGFALFGVLYTIYLQVTLSSRQEFETIFFHLLDIHNKNRDNVKFSYELEVDIDSDRFGSSAEVSMASAPRQRDVYGNEAFIKYYNLLRGMYSYARYTAKLTKIEPALKISSAIEYEITNMLYTGSDEKELLLDEKGVYNLSYDLYTKFSDKYYSSYARHLYQILKYVADNAPSEKIKKNSIRFLRAQLSITETALLYYRALWSSDRPNDDDRPKYQRYIEDTAFLHLLKDDPSVLFDEGNAGSMAETAFDWPSRKCPAP